MQLNMLKKDFNLSKIRKIVIYYVLLFIFLNLLFPNVIKGLGLLLILPLWLFLMFVGMINGLKIREYLADNYSKDDFPSTYKIWQIYTENASDKTIKIFQENAKSFTYLVLVVFISLPIIGFIIWIPWVEIYTDIFVNKVFE